MKHCRKCSTTKELSDFVKDRNKKDGLSTICRECRKEYKRINFDKLKIKKQLWNKNNKERIRKTTALYKQRNKERIELRLKEYRENNKEILKERNRKWRNTPGNKDRHYQMRKNWINNNNRDYQGKP